MNKYWVYGCIKYEYENINMNFLFTKIKNTTIF